MSRTWKDEPYIVRVLNKQYKKLHPVVEHYHVDRDCDATLDIAELLEREQEGLVWWREPYCRTVANMDSKQYCGCCEYDWDNRRIVSPTMVRNTLTEQRKLYNAGSEVD